ncbi:MAG: CPBP family intramembrane glutamic endopeptidase [Bryobacteraceae bacterium]|jgi:membrane protease YdiL (CAAX protease family)
MPRVRRVWGQYFISVLLVWVAACAAAYFYSQQKGIPGSVAVAVLPAFLVELALYILPGFAGVRRTLAALPAAVLALLLTGAAMAPYVLATVPLGSFHLASLLAVGAVAALIAFWYVPLKPRLATDLLFLAVIAAVFLSHAFRTLYPAPVRTLPLEILGRLMWVHTGIIAVLCIRGLEAGFGFVPRPREWRIGVLFTLCFLPVGALLGYLLHVARWHPITALSWKLPLLVLGRFLGVLWVLALAEEFFVRGFLQQILARSLKSEALGVLVTSLIFGALHLPFGSFPNWKLAILAAVAGVFYGVAFVRTRSIRAPMVMHALVVTTWQLFFNAHS